MEEFVIELSAQEKKIKELIEPILFNEGFELIFIKIAAGFSKPVLSIYVDKNNNNSENQEQGILLKDLTSISYLVGDILDMHDDENSAFSGKYELEVSSPGLDRPLSKIKHFEACIDSKIKIKLKKANENGSKKLSGILKSVNNKNLQILEEDKLGAMTCVDFDTIAYSNKIFIFESKQKPKKRIK